MLKNFLAMPALLKVLSMLGAFAPILAVISVLTGTIAPSDELHRSFGAAGDIFELVTIFLLSWPLFLGAYLIVRKSKLSRLLYLVGWLLICLSPLTLSVVRDNPHNFLVNFSFNAAIGLVIAVYLFRVNSVTAYFAGGPR